MKKMKSHWFLRGSGVLIALMVVLVLSIGIASAQTYPTKPIRLIIPFAPGGSNDIMGRLVAARLSERLGQQVVPENHPGAGGLLGTELAAKAAPDGYTLLIISSAYAINCSLYKITFDPIRSFTPVAKLGTGPNVFVVHPSVPASSVKEFVALARKHPGKLNFASAGIGSFQHLGTELFRMLTGLNFEIIQFKGGGPAMTDVLGGHTQAAIGSLIQFMPHIKAGRLKALGTGGAKRSPSLPDVPTIAEAGVPGYEANNWWGIVTPAGTPKPIVERLHKEITEIVRLPETQKVFEVQGAEDSEMNIAEFGRFIATEIAAWGKIIKDAKVTVK